MPYRKKYNRKRRRARPRRRKRSSRNSMQVVRVRNMSAFPDAMDVRLVYTSNALTSNTFLGNSQFRGNSCFDPDFTSTGHQPLAYDQFAAVYNRYYVRASTASITFQNNDTSNGLIASLIPTTLSAVTFTSSEDIREQPYAKVAWIGQVGSNNTRTLRSTMSTAKIRGKFSKYDESYASIVTDNPNRQWFWNVTTENANLSGSAVTANLSMTFIFYVRFYKRIDLSSS